MADALDLADGLKVIELCTGADAGCPTCVESQMGDAVSLWPATDWDAVAEQVPDPDNEEAWSCGDRYRLKQILATRRGLTR